MSSKSIALAYHHPFSETAASRLTPCGHPPRPTCGLPCSRRSATGPRSGGTALLGGVRLSQCFSKYHSVLPWTSIIFDDLNSVAVYFSCQLHSQRSVKCNGLLVARRCDGFQLCTALNEGEPHKMIVEATRQASPPVPLSDSYQMDVGSRLRL